MSTLVDLLSYGQSYWLDNLTRKKITGGELKKRVSEQGLRGITSNPSIFYKAITGSEDYDAQIKDLVLQGKTPQQVYDALTVKDVQDACDILKQVYDSSGGTDGFVSLEVAPYLARDTKGSIREAQRLHQLVGRDNCLIKIPGTKEGIPAIEQLLYEGININVTLLFSVDSYADVAHAYIRAVKRRVAEGKPVKNIVSVASFFLSRIDVLVDQLLGQYIIPGKTGKEMQPQLLLGKAAIASAQLAYKKFKEIFGTVEWKDLQSKGANVQRPLWASTSNKDPLASDVRYIETLIGPDTVNTLPDEAIDAFADHGKLQKNTIEQGADQADKIFEQLNNIGIDMRFVTQQLENDGIQKFIEPYNQLMTALADKRIKMLENNLSSQEISYGKLKKEITAAYTSMDEKQVGIRLYSKDPYLWKTDDEEQIKMIPESMGWITLPDNFKDETTELKDFARQVKDEGYKYAVLMGMGGSSLCSEVARETFGTSGGYMELLVLDNTDPDEILDVEKRIDLEKTLFIVATKSGGTKETLSFFRYFYDQLEKRGKGNTGNSFVAITDAGSPLVKIADDYKFRKTFINGSDIGGRYSVLSNFGLLPMALMGIDIDALMESARQMKVSSDAHIPAATNPGISLGVTLGLCQRHGRDKVTFILSSSISSFGFWVEQLIAESTGKEGKGLIPVNGETLNRPEVYGNDRIFIHMCLASDDSTADAEKLKALEDAGHPVIRIKVTDKLALGAEFYRWEIATATSGVIIGINPFDQPNVAESKKNTNNLLDEWQKEGHFKAAQPLFKNKDLTLFGGNKVTQIAQANSSVDEFIAAFGALAQSGDYIAFLPYFMMTEARTIALEGWRMAMRDKLKVATTLLNGPRYLHSTGQLHKGGPATGLYIILVSDEKNDLPIPGEKYGFGILHEAQSLGDYRSLDDKGRRVIRINLGADTDKGLKELLDAVKQNKVSQNA